MLHPELPIPLHSLSKIGLMDNSHVVWLIFLHLMMAEKWTASRGIQTQVHYLHAPLDLFHLIMACQVTLALSASWHGYRSLRSTFTLYHPLNLIRLPFLTIRLIHSSSTLFFSFLFVIFLPSSQFSDSLHILLIILLIFTLQGL